MRGCWTRNGHLKGDHVMMMDNLRLMCTLGNEKDKESRTG